MEGNDCVRGVQNFKLFLPTGRKREAELAVATMPPQLFHVAGQSSLFDPVVVLYIQGLGTKEWREFGRTEVIDNTLNPDFVRKFVLDFFFEEKQNLRFDVSAASQSLLMHFKLFPVKSLSEETAGRQKQTG
ncbi:Copine-8 [Channa argus]|uniref:Copine-8 n=1 Tax=Channa argus TaxID=215402 RepID=A0A6G1PGK7_CHAAH|nr:Copine-8 [Channa argus]